MILTRFSSFLWFYRLFDFSSLTVLLMASRSNTCVQFATQRNSLSHNLLNFLEPQKIASIGIMHMNSPVHSIKRVSHREFLSPIQELNCVDRNKMAHSSTIGHLALLEGFKVSPQSSQEFMCPLFTKLFQEVFEWESLCSTGNSWALCSSAGVWLRVESYQSATK